MVESIVHVWQVYLYEPVFNVLVWMYNNYTEQNFGWAVIYMTIALRVALLPFSIVAERNKVRYLALEEKIHQVEQSFRKDPVAMRIRIRELLRRSRVSPWAKTLGLVVQGVFFLLLYQVFIRGVNNQPFGSMLYPFVDHPGFINTNFDGRNISERSLYWAAVVGIVLFAGMWLEMRGKQLAKSDIYYLVFFPLSVFFLLWYLPMVKSLFIVTSLLFGYSIVALRKVLVRAPKST